MTRGLSAAHRSAMTYAPRPNYPLISILGPLNRWSLLRGYFRIQDIDLPAGDCARLRAAINPRTAAFVGPGHPEFGLDWIIDKELSSRFAPRMAFWTSHSIIAGAPWFWSRNNLVSHKDGSESFEYSVKWALAGNGVLLHPEGTVHWDGDAVHSLYKGIAAMAIEAARRSSVGVARPVYVVPVVWKLRYTRDVSDGMHADMEVIERECGLPSGRRFSVSRRFGALIDALGDDVSRNRYMSATLTQEHIHESLKRLRAERVRRTRGHLLRNVLPKPYGPRVVHMRVPEPILVTPDREIDGLLAETRQSMQDALARLTEEIAPLVDRYRRPNPFADAAASAAREHYRA